MDNRKRLPTPATVAPVPGTPPAFGLRAALAPPSWSAYSGCPWPRGHRGRSPGGPGGGTPHARSRPRRRRDAQAQRAAHRRMGVGGSDSPPSGGLVFPAVRARSALVAAILGAVLLSLLGHQLAHLLTLPASLRMRSRMAGCAAFGAAL